MTRNGYLCDDDCNRIEEYFINQMKKTVNKMWEAINDESRNDN